MKRSILFSAVLAAVSLPAAAALSQGTGTQRNPSQGQDQQGQGQQGAQGQGQQGAQGQAQPQGAQSAPKAETKGTTLAKEDREFVDEAAQGNLFEIRAGQLAAQKAQTDDVKRFGQRMVDDHTAMNSRLQKAVQPKGINLTQQLDKKHQEKIDSLSKKTGVDFDKSYMDDIVDHHKKDVDHFEKAAKDAKDPGVKDFAATTLPTLREHLQSAQSIKDKVKG